MKRLMFALILTLVAVFAIGCADDDKNQDQYRQGYQGQNPPSDQTIPCWNQHDSQWRSCDPCRYPYNLCGKRTWGTGNVYNYSLSQEQISKLPVLYVLGEVIEEPNNDTKASFMPVTTEGVEQVLEGQTLVRPLNF